MLTVDLIFRWMHILGAVVLAGGTIVWRFAVVPASLEMPVESRLALAAALRSRWSKLVMISSGLLLVSGLINFATIVMRYDISKGAFPGSMYHMLFGIKFLAAMVVFALAALLAGRSDAAERIRRNEGFWLSLNAALAVGVVCLGGLMRAADRQPKAAQSSRSTGNLERVAEIPPHLSVPRR